MKVSNFFNNVNLYKADAVKLSKIKKQYNTRFILEET